MVDLRTEYLGLSLPHPLMPGASPLVDDLDLVRRLEGAGAAAIVMHSLFEEQLQAEALASLLHVEAHADGNAEARGWFPDPPAFVLGPEQYLRQVAAIKAAVRVPVIASLNGVTPEGWTGFARRIEEAGADALELNLYQVPSDPEVGAEELEARAAEVVARVKGAVRIPVAVKLSPFWTSLPHLARRLEQAGADGLVLFNRFYQPDLDLDALEAVPTLHLSEPGPNGGAHGGGASGELLLRLRWTAILSGRVGCSLALTGGVHGVSDALKAVMAGAHAVQMTSALLRRGPEHLAWVLAGLEAWLAEKGYRSLREAQGSLSLARCSDPGAYERAQYLRVLHGWRPAPTP